MKRCIIFLILALAIIQFESAFAQSDSVRAQRTSDCCFTFTILNRNTSMAYINGISIKAITPGVTIRTNAAAPAGWVIDYPVQTSILFSSQLKMINPNESATGFSVCFNSPVNTFTLQWVTMIDGQMISSGSFVVSCRDVRDSVSVTKTPDGCCYNWRVKNRNSLGKNITGFGLRITTPGFSWGIGAQAPAGWSIIQARPDSIYYEGIQSLIFPGKELDSFITCLQPISGSKTPIKVLWTTYNDTTVLSRDSLTIQCDQMTRCDSLGFVVSTQGKCCFEFTLFNNNSSGLLLNDLHIVVLTPGASITGTPSGPWRTKMFGNTEVVFLSIDPGLPAGENLSGFTVCFENAPGNPGPVSIAWRSSRDGLIVCQNTLALLCGGAQRCDSISVTPSGTGVPPDACCYKLRLHNVHEPSGNLNGLSLKVLTPGATIAATPGGPWPLTSSSQTEAHFATSGTPLASGKSSGEFTLCVKNAGGAPGTILVSWQSLLNGAPVCLDTLRLSCAPIVGPRCDSFIVKNIQNCSYDFGLKNNHQPATPVDNIRIRVLNPGAGIHSPTAPAGWTIAGQTTQEIVFSATTGSVAPGATRTGFLATLNPATGGNVAVQLCSSYQGTPICCDTAAIQCTPAPLPCDSLLISPLIDDCAFDFGFINQHQPASAVNDFRLTVTTPGASIISAITPAGWKIETQTATQVLFKDTSGSVAPGGKQTGFELRFQTAPGNQNIFFQWCSSLNSQILCCVDSRVQCQPQGRCDSLIIKPSVEGCTFDLGFSNLHEPSSIVDDLHIDLLTSGATITSVTPPAGWIVDSQSGMNVVFRDTTGGVTPGNMRTGFKLKLAPPAGGGSIIFRWCTSLKGAILCCDSALVQCEATGDGCDSASVSDIAERPCCFDFAVMNRRQPPAPVNNVQITNISPEVFIFHSQTDNPSGWTSTGSDDTVKWTTQTSPILPGLWQSGFVLCFGNAGAGKQDFRVVWQTMLDTNTICADTIILKKCDTTLGVIGISGSTPGQFVLHQNFPNPFNPVTKIRFEIPYETDIELSVFDATGRRVADLGSGRYTAGTYEVAFDAARLPSATYFYRMKSGDFVSVKAMFLLK